MNGEIVPLTVSEKDLREEATRRAAKAGYTTKYGEPRGHTKIMSMPPTKLYEENYVKIFKHE